MANHMRLREISVGINLCEVLRMLLNLLRVVYCPVKQLARGSQNVTHLSALYVYTLYWRGRVELAYSRRTYVFRKIVHRRDNAVEEVAVIEVFLRNGREFLASL